MMFSSVDLSALCNTLSDIDVYAHKNSRCLRAAHTRLNKILFHAGFLTTTSLLQTLQPHITDRISTWTSPLSDFSPLTHSLSVWSASVENTVVWPLSGQPKKKEMNYAAFLLQFLFVVNKEFISFTERVLWESAGHTDKFHVPFEALSSVTVFLLTLQGFAPVKWRHLDRFLCICSQNTQLVGSKADAQVSRYANHTSEHCGVETMTSWK